MLRSLSVLAVLCCSAVSAVPATYTVVFNTDVPVGDGKIVVNVTTSYAPLGAERVYQLVQDKFFDEAAFFRVVPQFVVQFGIAGTPAENKKWDHTIKDDPVTQSNTAGTITFATAGANTRTTQLFINYIDNSRLDSMGFAPFGRVISGMDVAQAIFNPTPDSSGGIDQDQYMTRGNDWLRQNYPKANFITTATIQ
eukprot:TRINITY_DN25184_c2_g1_i1.p1 TRINITY_DN25184_c2_g1~~TRINITY_DN25184_c2_g1_i1.p1  ORF type:complete len:217 (+),score=92.30 TRINITY_DN25184_c2_g1_i1:67-651(+)